MTYAKRLLLLFAVVASFCFSASAQAVRAKFTLTQETQFGKTLLPPGDYTIDVANIATPHVLVSSASAKRLAFFAVPYTTAFESSCDSTTLSLKRSGSTWEVASVCFASTGMKLYFPTEKVATTVASADSQPASLASSR